MPRQGDSSRDRGDAVSRQPRPGLTDGSRQEVPPRPEQVARGRVEQETSDQIKKMQLANFDELFDAIKRDFHLAQNDPPLLSRLNAGEKTIDALFQEFTQTFQEKQSYNVFFMRGSIMDVQNAMRHLQTFSLTLFLPAHDTYQGFHTNSQQVSGFKQYLNSIPEDRFGRQELQTDLLHITPDLFVNSPMRRRCWLQFRYRLD